MRVTKMGDEMIQQTLTGKEANFGRVRPQTLIYCMECGERVLRRHRFEHDTAIADWAALDRLEELRDE